MASSDLYHDIFLEIIEYTIDINKKEVEGEKALLIAADDGDSEKIELLLKSGICVNAERYNKLLFCASKNYLTPLQIATLKDHDKCVQILIDYGADVNAKGLFGLTALHLAACNGFHNILKMLLRAKADCSVPIKISNWVIPKYSTTMKSCKIPRLGGTTPLHLAALNNSVNCVKELIRSGADFNAVDEHGRTSLYVAAQLGYSECVLIHLKEAVGRDILSLPSFRTSDTPLHFAVKHQMFDCVKELLYLGSDVNHRNFEGLSPLHIALLHSNSSICDQMEILKLLVLEGYKVDINQPDWQGFTPLHYVCFNGRHNKWCRRPELAKFLISYGANVNIKDYQKYSLLELELKHAEENFDILEYLVKSLLYLPRLKSLNVTSLLEAQNSNQLQQSNLRNQIEYQNRDWALIPFLQQRMPEPAQFHPAPDNIGIELDGVLPLPNRLARLNVVQRVHDAMQSPIDRSFVMDALMDLYGVFNDMSISENQNVMEQDANEAKSLILKKQLWYENISSSPRTLQHHCRFLIRKVLGLMKLKYIKRLPIPPVLQSYLLFELGE